MKFLALLAFAFLVVSCGPRDDEKLMNQGAGGNQGYNLNADQVVTETQAGLKLPSCRKQDQPTWNTIRLYKETAFLFDKVDQLKVVVGRGDFNCVPVSQDQPVEIEVQEAQWRKTGVFYFVTKLELMNLQHFLSDPEWVKNIAADMAMSEAQLREFLSAGNPRPQITITYLKSSKDAPPPKTDNYTLESGYVLSAEKEGLKLPTCTAANDPTWSTLRLPFALNEMLTKANEVGVIVNNQSRNCVPVSLQKTIELETQGTLDSPYKAFGQFYLVQKLSLVNRQYLLADEEWLTELSASMQIRLETLKTYLQAEEASEVVSLTYVTPSAEISEPTASPIKEIRLPEAEGQTLSECGNQFWTDVRLVPEVQTQVQAALDNKTLKAIVNSGDRNCLPLGSVVSVSIKEDKWVPFPNGKIKIVGVMSLDRAQFENIPFLGEKISEEMGMEYGAFLQYTQSLKGDLVNVTRFQWVE